MQLDEFSSLEEVITNAFRKSIRESASWDYVVRIGAARRRHSRKLVREVVEEVLKQFLHRTREELEFGVRLDELLQTPSDAEQLIRVLTKEYVKYIESIVFCSCGQPIRSGDKCYMGIARRGRQKNLLLELWCLTCGPHAIDSDGNPAKYVNPDRLKKQLVQ